MFSSWLQLNFSKLNKYDATRTIPVKSKTEISITTTYQKIIFTLFNL